MNKISTLVLIALVPLGLTTTVTASEETVATEVEVANIVKLCNQDAEDDEVEAESLKEYLSICINDELSVNGFKQLASEHISELINK